LLALSQSGIWTSPSNAQLELVAYVGVFSALFTLALFAYEIRGILMCHDLYATGRNLEKLMALDGQFTKCDESRLVARYYSVARVRVARLFNGESTPCAVYSLVFAAWLFIGLRFGFNVELPNCVRLAAGVGIVLTLITSWLMHVLTHKRKVAVTTVAPDTTQVVAT
jgi:hypothetical protein